MTKKAGKKGPPPKTKVADPSESESEESDTEHTSHRSSRNKSKSGDHDLISAVLKLLTQVTNLIDQNSKLMSQLTEYQQNQTDLLKRIEILEKDRGGWKGAGSRAAPADVEVLVSTVSDEMEARKEKQCNIVVYGLAELPVVGDEQPSEDDEQEAVTNLLKDDLEIDQPVVTRAYRMGRVRSDGKPRPLKVHLADVTEKKTVLQNTKKLGKLPSTNAHSKVFIRSDWTPLQREQDYRR